MLNRSLLLLCLFNALQHSGAQEVRLVDGLNSCQGRLEIFLPTSNGFGQACDLDASANEVRVVCRQIGCETVGVRRVDPRTYGFSPAINVYSAFGFLCNGNETGLFACSEPGAVCRADDPDFAIAVECGGETTLNVRLVDGIDRCQGRVENRLSARASFAQSCDLDADDNEAQVICMELGCEPSGARRVNPTDYGFSPAINAYQVFGFSCTGNESTLVDCLGTGGVCQADSVDHALAVECGVSEPFLLCGPLDLPANGNVDISGPFIGDMAVYTCDPDFSLANENGLGTASFTRICQENGEWSGFEPVCQSASTMTAEITTDANPTNADDPLKKWLGGLCAILATLLLGVILAWVWSCHRNKSQDRGLTTHPEPEVTFPNPSYDHTPAMNTHFSNPSSSLQDNTDDSSATYEVIPENIGSTH